MATKEEIKEQFQLLNVDPSNEVINKCLEICTNHNVEAEDLVDQWFAFTTSVLRGAAPTVEFLDKMERHEYLKGNKEQSGKIGAAAVKEQSPQVSIENNHSSVPNTDVLGTPKGSHTPVSKIQTPVQSKKLLDSIMESTFSSPSTPSSGSYSQRTGARSVQCSYGSKNATFKSDSSITLTVKPVFEETFKPTRRLMYDILAKRAGCVSNMAEDLIKAMRKKYGLGEEDTDQENGASSLFFGKIVSECGEKLNPQSMLLELTQNNKGQTLQLILSKVAKCSLFPGQVVGIKGGFEKTSDKHRGRLTVEEFYIDTDFDFAPEPPVISGALQLVIACGPFTTRDNLQFEPLTDLLHYVKEHKPHVLVLAGPFYDKTHVGIENGDLKQTFDSFFFDIVDKVMTTLGNSGVHVVISSSQKEPHHFPVYPTPAYEVRGDYENLTLLPDPFLVDVHGLVIGATTADVLFDISVFEVFRDRTKSGPADRMGRIASHLLKQQNFYPLDPANKGMCLDMSLMETYGVMGVKPHILVCPSNLRHFVKEIDNCLIINPERLTKGNGGGTFARIQINAGTTATVCGRTVCEVLRI